MKLSELYWHRITPLHLLLWPVSLLYECFLLLKKLCYWLEILPSTKFPVPVIVIDSLSTIDHSKPPVILWVVDTLKRNGYTPGIITRGQSDYSGLPRAVTAFTSTDDIDNKTSLLAEHCGKSCPVWIGDNLITVAQAMLHAHPSCNVIICIDGLSYFRLERDIEFVIIDFNVQSYGNGMLLPAGPLCMSLRSLAKTSIIITNENSHTKNSIEWPNRTFRMKLINEIAYNVIDPTTHCSITHFKNKKLHAISSDDHAQWFFELIHNSGLSAQLHDYREHHLFKLSEIEFPEADVILMPEENALQCKEFAHTKLWAVSRRAWITDDLQSILMQKLKEPS